MKNMLGKSSVLQNKAAKQKTLYLSVCSCSLQFITLIHLIFILNCNCYGQKFLIDTLYVEFRGDTLAGAGEVCILKILDNRNEDPAFVMYETRKKLLLFPSDLEIHTTKPLAEAMLEGFNKEKCHDSYTIHIDRFEVEKRKLRFSSMSFINATLPVFENKDDSLLFLGTLYYDYPYRPLNKKEPIKRSIESHLHNWHATFQEDLVSINATAQGKPAEPVLNFITDPDIRPLYLNLLTGAFAGQNWYGLQAEIFFSRPEIHGKNKHVSGIIRYQNNVDYESVSMGKNSEHFTFRRDKNLAFDIDLNFLLGFLKWKNVHVHQPTLYQLINLEISSIQSVMYTRLNKQGFTGRLGIMETMGYVFDKKLRFQAGGFLGLGYTF